MKINICGLVAYLLSNSPHISCLFSECIEFCVLCINNKHHQQNFYQDRVWCNIILTLYPFLKELSRMGDT